jgi:hypothetical protein
MCGCANEQPNLCIYTFAHPLIRKFAHYLLIMLALSGRQSSWAIELLQYPGFFR